METGTKCSAATFCHQSSGHISGLANRTSYSWGHSSPTLLEGNFHLWLLQQLHFPLWRVTRQRMENVSHHCPICADNLIPYTILENVSSVFVSWQRQATLFAVLFSLPAFSGKIIANKMRIPQATSTWLPGVGFFSFPCPPHWFPAHSLPPFLSLSVSLSAEALDNNLYRLFWGSQVCSGAAWEHTNPFPPSHREN